MRGRSKETAQHILKLFFLHWLTSPRPISRFQLTDLSKSESQIQLPRIRQPDTVNSDPFVFYIRVHSISLFPLFLSRIIWASSSNRKTLTPPFSSASMLLNPSIHSLTHHTHLHAHSSPTPPPCSLMVHYWVTKHTHTYGEMCSSFALYSHKLPSATFLPRRCGLQVCVCSSSAGICSLKVSCKIVLADSAVCYLMFA